jgi:hypothetical protein
MYETFNNKTGDCDLFGHMSSIWSNLLKDMKRIKKPDRK